MTSSSIFSIHASYGPKSPMDIGQLSCHHNKIQYSNTTTNDTVIHSTI